MSDERPTSGSEAAEMKDRWFQILLSLADGSRNGQEIMRDVLETTNGRIQLWPGALYGSLKELRARSWVEEENSAGREVRGGNPRYYRMTETGRRVLKEELRHLEGLLKKARGKVLLREGGGR